MTTKVQRQLLKEMDGMKEPHVLRVSDGLLLMDGSTKKGVVKPQTLRALMKSEKLIWADNGVFARPGDEWWR